MPPVDWYQFNFLTNLGNLSVQDVPEAEIIRQFYPKWMTTPDEFAADDFQRLLDQLQANGNFWMMAVIEYRLTELLATIQTTLDTDFATMIQSLANIDANTAP